MVGNIRILLTFFCGLILLGGCQSEADFPAVCGNDLRESGEACDGEDLNPSQDSCEELGQGNGPVGCHDDCTLDTSSCVETAICDPIEQTGCSGYFSCYISNTQGELGCLPTSTGALGKPCSTGAYCEPGLVCPFGYATNCYKLCRINNDCLGIGSGTCNSSIVELETGLGVCL
jgi:hypothetical protein